MITAAIAIVVIASLRYSGLACWNEAGVGWAGGRGQEATGGWWASQRHKGFLAMEVCSTKTLANSSHYAFVVFFVFRFPLAQNAVL